MSAGLRSADSHPTRGPRSLDPGRRGAPGGPAAPAPWSESEPVALAQGWIGDGTRPDRADIEWSAEAELAVGPVFGRLERDELLDALARELDRAATAAGISEDA